MKMDWQPIETAPMDGKHMAVKCADGTVGLDSLNGNGPAGGDDDGETWEWWATSKSPRTHWTRDQKTMKDLR
jgi:hypothetical protein